MFLLPEYAGAANDDLAVTVQSVVYAFDKDEYLPKDPNWAQISLRIQNVSDQVITLDAVKSKQSSGVVLESAGTVLQLAEPPDIRTEVAKSGGIAVAGHMAGMFIFPPLAILGGIGSMFGLFGGQRKWKKKMKAIEASALRTGMMATESLVEGNIYIPATTKQSELVIFYTKNGVTDSLSIPVSGHRQFEPNNKKRKKFGIF